MSARGLARSSIVEFSGISWQCVGASSSAADNRSVAQHASSSEANRNHLKSFHSVRRNGGEQTDPPGELPVAFARLVLFQHALKYEAKLPRVDS